MQPHDMHRVPHRILLALPRRNRALNDARALQPKGLKPLRRKAVREWGAAPAAPSAVGGAHLRAPADAPSPSPRPLGLPACSLAFACVLPVPVLPSRVRPGMLGGRVSRGRRHAQFPRSPGIQPLLAALRAVHPMRRGQSTSAPNGRHRRRRRPGWPRRGRRRVSDATDVVCVCCSCYHPCPLRLNAGGSSSSLLLSSLIILLSIS
mmetsp:Transcript_19462/g.39351  ORF Transcript_19462/g.39351 Transcript_19462/m.39351 type:complete len:206 (-) Transcript_19462:484-1101(-)